MNLLLIGFKSVGKTMIGRALAQLIGFDFIDLDSTIEKLFYKQYYLPYKTRKIYKMLGQDDFRMLENHALNGLNLSNTVLALGGGIIDGIFKDKNVEKMKSMGKIIYLKDSRKKIMQRINKGGLPAFAQFNKDCENNVNDVYSKLFDFREPIYESIADLIIDLDERDGFSNLTNIINIL